MEEIKLFEMFSGFRGASHSLAKEGIEFTSVGHSEIDKYAIQCGDQNFPGVKNFGDCTKINPNNIPDFDLLTGGFPCQSFSVAGKGLGELDTRGTLFNEIIRIAEVKQPKYMLLENVKGLLSKKHKDTFEKILYELKRIGYHVYWKVLNSKEHGIPQNRERVFFVCFRNDIYNGGFEFPQKEELKIFLKDILEDIVDEKYYLKKEQVEKLISGQISTFRSRNLIKNNFSPTLQSAMSHGNTIPCIKQSFIINPLQISSTQKHNTITRSGINNCLPSAMGLGGGHTPMVEDINKNKFLIRKLTPKECFRLMGFLDDKINLNEISNSQRYKLAGNGWDINLVSKIFKNMFKVNQQLNNNNVKDKLTDYM